jgi:hypothetical protein
MLIPDLEFSIPYLKFTIPDPGSGYATLNWLKNLGIFNPKIPDLEFSIPYLKFTIPDPGSGYATLNWLKHLGIFNPKICY